MWSLLLKGSIDLCNQSNADARKKYLRVTDMFYSKTSVQRKQTYPELPIRNTGSALWGTPSMFPNLKWLELFHGFMAVFKFFIIRLKQCSESWVQTSSISSIKLLSANQDTSFWATALDSSSVLMRSSPYDNVSRSTCTVCWPIRGGGVGPFGEKLLNRTAGPEHKHTNRSQGVSTSLTSSLRWRYLPQLYRRLTKVVKTEIRFICCI